VGRKVSRITTRIIALWESLRLPAAGRLGAQSFCDTGECTILSVIIAKKVNTKHPFLRASLAFEIFVLDMALCCLPKAWPKACPDPEQESGNLPSFGNSCAEGYGSTFGGRFKTHAIP